MAWQAARSEELNVCTRKEGHRCEVSAPRNDFALSADILSAGRERASERARLPRAPIARSRALRTLPRCPDGTGPARPELSWARAAQGTRRQSQRLLPLCMLACSSFKISTARVLLGESSSSFGHHTTPPLPTFPNHYSSTTTVGVISQWH